MKKTIMTVLLVVTIIACTLSFENVSFAEDYSAVFSLTSSQTNLKVGDIFEVNIVINSLTGFSGIQTFIANKNFDSSIFEYVGTEGKNGWEVKGDDTKIVLRKESGESNSGTIAVMKFKTLKTDLSAKIQLTELDCSGDSGDVYYDDGNVNSPFITLQIKDVERPNTNTETPTTNTEKPTTNTEKPSSNTEKPATNTNKPATNTNKPANNDKTTTQNKIPQTGENYTAVILVAAGVVVASLLYIKYRKYEKDIK